jgi:hypothetical protein
MDQTDERMMTCLLGRREAIWFINRAALEDAAYKLVYKRKVLREIRRPLMYLVGYQAKYNEWPSAKKLNALVQEANECSLPTARKHVKRAVDLGLISREKDEGDARMVYYFLNEKQRCRAQEIITLLSRIDKVVEEQAANPYDKDAGRDLVPPGMYYNIIETF